MNGNCFKQLAPPENYFSIFWSIHLHEDWPICIGWVNGAHLNISHWHDLHINEGQSHDALWLIRFIAFRIAFFTQLNLSNANILLNWFQCWANKLNELNLNFKWISGRYLGAKRCKQQTMQPIEMSQASGDRSADAMTEDSGGISSGRPWPLNSRRRIRSTRL